MAPRVGFVGLGAMGKGMALTLARKNYPLQVFDVRPEAAADLEALGAKRTDSPKACAEGVDVLVVAVLNAQQVTSVLFDGPTAALGDFKGTCILCATVSPAFAQESAAKAAAMGAKYVDAPMSGGSVRAGSGDLTFMVSADSDAMSSCRSVLDAMGKTFVVGSQPGLGSSMKLVNQILAGVHIAAAAEAMALAAREGLNTQQVYDIISTAAGNSFMFGNRVPHMLSDDPTPHSAIDIWPKDLGIVLDEARRLGFPCPMAGVALQQFLAAKGMGLGSKDDSFVVKAYEKFGGGYKVASPASEAPAAATSLAAEKAPLRVGFVGLGAMGNGMATTLASKGVDLQVYDVRPDAYAALEALGARSTASPKACAEGTDVIVVSVLNAKQVSSVLFDGPGAILGEQGYRGICIVCATVSPEFAKETADRVAALGASLVDAPMSGGSVRAGKGELTFMVSAAAEPLNRCRSVLEIMGKVFVLGDVAGMGSSMKLVNQVLAGVHIAVAAEAMAFGARAGLNTRQVYEIITTAAGNSFMFENRVPHMLDDDPTPHSRVDIWPKDLGIVMDEARRLGFPCPLTAQALQQFLAAKGMGLSDSDDSFVVKVYEACGGYSVASQATPEATKKDDGYPVPS